MKKFALIGAAGYIAPRHMDAIKRTGNVLVAALDKNDSVGIIDSYFPDAHFFTEFERFDRFLEKERMRGEKIDYVSICSPNYLHDAHIRFGLRIGANVICEKPLVINPWNLDSLEEIEKCSIGKINTILQLRLYPEIIALKKKYENTSKIHNVELKYVTPRGSWYFYSWKGNEEKSGGILYNIGIHFFDMLNWIFGEYVENKILFHDKKRISGLLVLEKANVKWFLSLDRKDLEEKYKSYRSIKIDGEEIDFSVNFENLHYECYKSILNGEGYGIKDVKESIKTVYNIKGGNSG